MLRLTGTIVDASRRLSGFDDTIAGLNVGSSTTPTNFIDLSSIAPSGIDSITLNGTTIEVTEVAGPVFDLTLAGAPSGFVNWTSDGGSGTAVFLAGSPAFTARNVIDSWLDPASWGGFVPPTEPVSGLFANFTFFNFAGSGNGSNAVPPGNDVILMPTSLGQATGSTIWTISDSRNTDQFTSSLSLTNQGIIYVNNTANFIGHNSNTGVGWSLFGDTAVTAHGMQLFENDGILAVVGGASDGTATNATFTGNLSVTGSGYIDVIGKSSLVFNTNVSVSSSHDQSNLSPMGDNTFGGVIEASALLVHGRRSRVSCRAMSCCWKAWEYRRRRHCRCNWLMAGQTFLYKVIYKGTSWPWPRSPSSAISPAPAILFWSTSTLAPMAARS